MDYMDDGWQHITAVRHLQLPCVLPCSQGNRSIRSNSEQRPGSSGQARHVGLLCVAGVCCGPPLLAAGQPHKTKTKVSLCTE